MLHLLHMKHKEERQLLVEMLINPRFENTQREAVLETDQQRNDRLAVLRSKRQSSNLGPFSAACGCPFWFLTTCLFIPPSALPGLSETWSTRINIFLHEFVSWCFQPRRSSTKCMKNKYFIFHAWHLLFLSMNKNCYRSVGCGVCVCV